MRHTLRGLVGKLGDSPLCLVLGSLAYMYIQGSQIFRASFT